MYANDVMHLPHSIAIRPNLELKTQPKQLLGSLPLDIAPVSLQSAITIVSTLLNGDASQIK
jgi:hypothetical protein